PIFIAPDVTQQYQHEPGEVENEFFNRNRSAHRGYFPTNSCQLVWENKKGVAKKQVEQKTEWRQHSDRSPEGFSRKLQIGSASKPPAQRADGEDKQERAPRVSEQRRVIRRDLQNDGVNNRPQRERSWNDKRGCDGENYIGRSSLLHAPKV